MSKVTFSDKPFEEEFEQNDGSVLRLGEAHITESGHAPSTLIVALITNESGETCVNFAYGADLAGIRSQPYLALDSDSSRAFLRLAARAYSFLRSKEKSKSDE